MLPEFKKVFLFAFIAFSLGAKAQQADNKQTAFTLQQAIDYAKDQGETECFIIGGGDIFIQALIWTDKIYFTRIHHDFEGDTFFPALNKTDWKEIKNDKHLPDEKNKYAYSFLVYERNYE